MNESKVFNNLETLNYINNIKYFFDKCNITELDNSLNYLIDNNYKLDINLKKNLNIFIDKILNKKNININEYNIIIKIIYFIKNDKSIITDNLLLKIIDKIFLYTKLNENKYNIIIFIADIDNIFKDYINLYNNKLLNKNISKNTIKNIYNKLDKEKAKRIQN